MADVVSVALIGAGVNAGTHMRTTVENPNSRLVAVMDVDADRASAAGEKHSVRAYTDLGSVLADAEVEAVVISTPNCFHAAQAIASAEAGKHVLVEKPMALTVGDCDRMIEASDAAGKVLMVGQSLRHSPVNRKVKALIAEGAIGTVGHLMRRRYGCFDPTSPTEESGKPERGWYVDLATAGNCLLYGFGAHEYDILHWYMDSPVVRVYAQGTESTELYRGQEDSYSAVMTHANGAVSVLSQSVVCRGGPNDQHIVGSEGTILISSRQLRVNGKEVAVEGSEDSKLSQTAEFATCCLEGKEPDASGRSVRHTMAVIEAAAQSAERNAPVLVSELG